MATKVDASGSSSVGDIYMWFLGTGGGASNKVATEKAGPALLRVGGLAAGTTGEDLHGLFGKYYNTVGTVSLIGSSSASVAFSNHAERDKAVIELNGTSLKGARLQLSKQQPQAAAGAAVARKRTRDGSLADETIHALLLEREAARRRRDYTSADALVTELKQAGVLIDSASGTWRAADGQPTDAPDRHRRGRRRRRAGRRRRVSHVLRSSVG